MIVLVVCLLACSCDSITGEVKDIGADFAEVSYCEVETCGQVFLCTMPDGSTNEWCWSNDDADDLARSSGAVSCSPTPRGGSLGWPCLYSCTPHRGCNAYAGCFCR